MRISAGIYKGSTNFGKSIRNGNAALLVQDNDNELHLHAVAEERITRVKYASGYEHALRALLESVGASEDDIEEIAISSCCEPESDITKGTTFGSSPRLRAVGHHESHATLAFLGSGFESALVVVSDGGGDVLETPSSTEWWRHSREQQTYYLASKSGRLEIVGRDFDEPYAVGIGEMYRAFTYFLGWHGSRHASKVMALSGLSLGRNNWPELYEFNKDSPQAPIRNDPLNPVAMVDELARTLGVDWGEPRVPGSELLQIHKDLAAYIQSNLESLVVRQLRRRLEGLDVDGVCLGGGVALNVLANGRIAARIGKPVYVASAPGDEGQALGAVMATNWQVLRDQAKSLTLTASESAHLGPRRRIDSAAVTSVLAESGHSDYTVFELANLDEGLAHCLADGAAVCLFQERSEYGPRALGSRSIIADPRRVEARAIFNTLKERDWFMPFAPALTYSPNIDPRVSPQFPSPFMSFAFRVTDKGQADLVGVLGNDSSARVQTVETNGTSLLARVIRKFYERTGTPSVLNTSFNAGGEPIVETLADAVKTFESLPVNLLAAGRFVIAKALTPDLTSARIAPQQFYPDVTVVNGRSISVLEMRSMLPRECIRSAHRATGLVVFVRSELPLYGPYLDWLREGRKVTTIRYRKGAVELPAFARLPLYETEDYGVGDRSRPTAFVRVGAMRYQIFGELTEDDARRDGFESRDHMRTDLHAIYPNLTDDSWVTIYDIQLFQDLAKYRKRTG